jgi:hypothetical protein
VSQCAGAEQLAAIRKARVVLSLSPQSKDNASQLMPSLDAKLPVIIRQSGEVFPTKEAAWRDANDALQEANARPDADAGT